MTLQEAIKKFEDLPEHYFSYSYDVSPTDAWEWLNEEQAKDLHAIIKPFGLLIQVNDGIGEWKAFGNNPKQRVVRFLTYVSRAIKTPALRIST